MRQNCHSPGFTIIELMTVVTIVGTLAAIAVPNFVGFSDHAKFAAVKSNSHTVQISAEDFSVRNEGVYPAAIGAAGLDGNSLQDLLPEGQLLRNPYTDALSEPSDGVPAAPGEIGYAPILTGGIAEGYVIRGHDRNAVAFVISSD